MKTIFQTKKEHDTYEQGEFIPVFDETDHFDFICKNCRNVAKTIAVIFLTKTEHSEFPLVSYQLVCEICKESGRRKIYLNSNGSFLRLYAPPNLNNERLSRWLPGNMEMVTDGLY